MIVNEEHTNRYGTLHGGFTASAVDLYSGLALLTHPKVVADIDTPNCKSSVSVDIHVSYVVFKTF